MEKTLEIKVYDSIGINEGIPRRERKEFVFDFVFIERPINKLFGGVNNYSRPPTQGFTTNLAERAFSAFSSKFMVSSLTI